MREVEVTIAPDARLDNGEAVIEAACAAEGLRLTLKGTLKQYPGRVHWHYKRGKEAGTLESMPKLEGRRMIAIFTPKGKKKAEK